MQGSGTNNGFHHWILSFALSWEVPSILCPLRRGHRADETHWPHSSEVREQIPPYPKKTPAVASGSSSCHFGTTPPPGAASRRISLSVSHPSKQVMSALKAVQLEACNDLSMQVSSYGRSFSFRSQTIYTFQHKHWCLE